MDMADYGWNSDFSENDGTVLARVTAVHRERYEIVCAKGVGFAQLKASVYYHDADAVFPTTGDFVTADWNDSGDSRIVRTLPRKTEFQRLDPSSAGTREQVVAANFDTVFILQSLNHDFNARRLERYLTLAWQSGAMPVVVLTKTDLVENYAAMQSEAMTVAFGVDVYAVSAKTGQGLDDLKKYVQPRKTLVFLGSSGVGKSSLVNALAGAEVMTTAAIREDDSKGRHTTTHRQLIVLPNGALVIDTPGMRELGLWDAADGLDRTFSDVTRFLGLCRFNDCTHTNEPDCAVRQAIENGALSPERWEAYSRLEKESAFTADKEGYLVTKEKKFRTIAKINKQNRIK